MVVVNIVSAGRRTISTIALMIVAIACSTCWAEVAFKDEESQIKAAFLYRFLHYVEWPPPAFEEADSPIVIGVLGADALAEDLARLVAGRSVLGHPVTTRRLKPGDSLAGLQMLFVGRAESARVATLADWSKGLPLLVVSEDDQAFAHGSAINFVVVENKVRFDVALAPAEQARLRISSRLLALARKVRPGLS
jgi:hypothetical protein